MAELRVGAATDTGRVRPQNEDNLLVTDSAFVVADGMGGHEAGEVASRIAVDRIGQLLAELRASAGSSAGSTAAATAAATAGLSTESSSGDADESSSGNEGAEGVDGSDDGSDDTHPPVSALPTAVQFVSAISTANADIVRAAAADPALRGMGTTVTAIAVIADPKAGRGAPNLGDDDPTAGDAPGDTSAPEPGDVTPVTPEVPSEALVLANVGDSRTYLFRHHRLRRVTIDHSYVQELVATGHITEHEARTHPRRNIITRALGIEHDVRVDWWTLPLIRGDRFVLCSDGLVDEVADQDITAILAAHDDPQEAADLLVDAANAAGGRDNITVIVVDVLEGDDPPDPTLEIDVVPRWADDATLPTPAGPLSVDADPTDSTGRLDAVAFDAATGTTDRGKRSGIAKFALGFAAAAVLVVGFVVFSAWASSGYFIAFDDDDQAIIYQGRDGGVLWISPTAQNQGGPTRDQLEPERADLIDGRPRFDSQQEAVDFLRDSATTTTTTTSTTTTTTTTTVPGTTIEGAAAAATGAPTGVTTGVTTTSAP